MKKVAIVGAGFSGAVIARQLVETGEYQVQVFDQRSHLGGNCHTERDQSTGVMLHVYGPHIFHTSNDTVWQYMQRFGKWRPFTNRVKAITHKGIFSLPINLLTINQFFGKTMSPREAQDFIGQIADPSIKDPRTFEEQALKFVGRDLYEAFFKGYTQKQWGVSPRELPASILKRLPVRFNYDDNYFNDTYQGMPEDGYTSIIANMLDHKAISTEMNRRISRDELEKFDHAFYSGPIDEFFDFKLGALRYRSLNFEKFYAEGDFQGNAVINYCDYNVPFTRITEHKHFAPWENHDRSVCYKEYSKVCEKGDIPYYPLGLEPDAQLYAQYKELAQTVRKVTFIGRLATYRYMDMHVCIAEALDLAEKFTGKRST